MTIVGFQVYTQMYEGLVAAKAGVGPGMKIAAVNGKRFSNEVFRDALKAAGKTRASTSSSVVAARRSTNWWLS